jgi:predicted RNA binding protein YcfA (HicA-like mRNA interferase family)
MSLSSRQVLKRLSDDGWKPDRTSGSHVQLIHATKPGTVTVPHPRKDFPLKTLKSIEKLSGVKLR